MEIRCDVGGGRRLVVLHGDLDLCSAALLERALDGANGVGETVVDVSDVGFIDCAGLAALVRARQTVHADGTAFAVVGVHPPVDRLLDVTRLRALLGVRAVA